MQFARKIGYLLSFGAFAVYTASRAQSLHFDIEVFTPGGPVLGSPLGVRFFGDQNLLIQGKPPVDAATGRSIWPANFRDFPGGPYSTDDPGFQSFAGVLLRGERLFYRPLESLLYWTPQSQNWSAAAPGTSVRIEGTVPPEVAIGALVHNEPAAQLLYQYYSTPTSITGSGIVGPTTKLIDEASANGSFHTHLNWFLESTGGAGTQPVGAYLLGLQLFDPIGKYRDSAPFYVLFNNGLTTLDYQGAFLSRLDAPTVPPGPVAPPERPPILPPTFPRFTAGSDGELAPLGSPATLSLLTLQSTASFTTARNFNIGPEPAAIDTTGFDLSIAGAITATSRLEKTGEGTLTLTGPNTWVVAPLVSQGTLKGPAASLQTAITNHGTVEFAQSVDATYGHVLSGTGDMRKSGNAVLSLTNINTYTGGTTITGGTLALVNAGSLSPDAPLRVEGGAVFDLSAANGARSAGSIAGAGTIRLGANGLTVGSDRSSTSFSGAIEGTGLFSKVGTGTLDLSGATGHTGTTRIAEGTLLARARSLGSQVVNEGTLVIAESLAVSPLETYGGNISGSGGLVKRGDGALRLRGVNSYAGGTVIEQGMLIGDHISIQGTIVNNGGLAFDQTSDGTFAGAVSGTGMLLKSGSGNLTLSGINSYSGGTRLSGPLTIADDRNLGAVSGGVVINGGTLRTTADIATTRSFALGDTGAVFDTGANTTFAINSNITGPGSLDKIGAGTLQLTGQHTYSGPTTVAQGLLAFRGSLAGSVRVAGGAALAASGVIAGHLDLAPGSVFKVNVDPSAGTDHLALRSATVDGAALEVIAREGEYPLKGRHVVLSAAEQISGRFGSASSNLAFLRPTLDYDPQNVYLSLERTDATYQSVARTPAQVGVATALGALSRLDSPDARTVIGAVDGLTPERARAAFDSIGGVGRASIVTAQRSSQRALWQQVVARLGAADGGGAGGRAANVALAGFGSLDPWIVSDANPAYAHSLAGAGTASGESEPRDGFWLRGYGGRGRADGAPGAGPTRFDFSGVIAGYDRSIDEQMRFGALAAYSTPEIEQDVLGSRFDGETRQLALYGRYRTGALRIDALAGLADTDTKTTRAVTIGALRRTASASYGGTIATAHIEAGYTFGDTTRLEPIASLQWSYQRDDAYTESGAGALNLAVPRRTMSFLRSTLGINAARDLSSGGMQGMLEARLAWAHEFASQGSLSARFAGDPSNATFSIPTVDVPRDSTIIGLGMSVRATRGLRFYADLAGEFNSAQKLYSVGMGLRYEWENAAPERSSAFWGLRPNSPGPSALLLAESAPVVSPEVKAEGEHEVSADSNAARPESYTHGQEMRHKQGATSLVAASEPVKPGVEVGGKRVASADAQPRPDMRPRSDALRQNKGAAVLLAASEPVELPEIKVEGKREGSADSDARPETRLQGEELRQKQRSTLGATLQDELGVANASFGPSVGLPVIRGFTGPRVRILLDGLGSHDASSVSPDHAITIEPLLAEEVRVMRGPAAVRYGGAAIGGAVEVIDGRIPERIPKNGLAGAAEVRFNSNANEKAQAFKLDAGKQLFALHLDGFNRSRGNTDIPGCAIDEEAIVRQFGLFNATNTCGHVANTDARSHGVTLGASLLDDRSMLGFAIGDLRNNYGIPPGAHSHSHVAGAPPAADAVRIDMKQQRQDAKAAFRFDGPVERLELRAGHVDYEHAELDNNVVQTTFRNEVWEGRAELSHRLAKNLSGTIGGQWIKRDFSALGAEAFVPESAIRSHAGYITQRLNLDPFSFELGARSEYQRIRPEPQRTVFGTTVVLPDTDHTSRSYSAAASLQFAARSSATLTLSRAQRNPDVQELYALGPHLATRTFDVGNNRLNTETVQGADFGLSVDRGTYAGKVNVFGYRVKDFIYQRNAGVFYDPDVRQIRVRCVRLDECLPVQRYEQDDARFTGFEAQFVMRLDVPFGLLEIKPFMDFLRARLEDGTDVPRLPPRRYGLELAFVGEKWSAAIRHTRADAQTRPGVNEAETAGYDQLNAFFEYRLGGRPFETVVFVQGRNLLDNQIRNSVSFLRNYAPEAGRAIEVGLRASF
jgi:iron complex outermembrane receptor protein